MEWFFRTTPGPVGDTTFGEIGGGSPRVRGTGDPDLFLRVG